MSKSFYTYLMTQRNPMSHDEIAQFADNAFLDQTFPKQATDYDDLSRYLEENAGYLPNMSIFDETYQQYQETN
ncbi:YozE family protein [Loigolactobacillus bifermentans]|nr:YozE family protein [Loigolactobacillus bifermentans]QGG59376.1 YozE family protein [Loigolactobacillus bifermentans]